MKRKYNPNAKAHKGNARQGSLVSVRTYERDIVIKRRFRKGTDFATLKNYDLQTGADGSTLLYYRGKLAFVYNKHKGMISVRTNRFAVGMHIRSILSLHGYDYTVLKEHYMVLERGNMQVFSVPKLGQ